MLKTAPEIPGAAPHARTPLFTVRVLDAMRGTRPWVLFVSFLSFAGALGTVAAAFVQISRGEGSFHLTYVWGLSAALYVAPGVLLFRYAQAIARFVETGASTSLELALAVQRTFWRMLGVVTLIMLGVVLAVMLGAIAFT